MGIKITKRANGILFDTSDLPGSGVDIAKYKFVPSSFGNIEDILLYNDRVAASSSTGASYSLTLTGVDNTYPVSEIGGIVVTDLEDAFFKFIDLL
jgi:hypothetical protein